MRCVVCDVVWCVVRGVWCVVGCWALCAVCGVWCVVCGVRCAVCGVWCVVCVAESKQARSLFNALRVVCCVCAWCVLQAL